MTRGKILAICQLGGEFVVSNDGSMMYVGGEAHAIDIGRDTTINDLLSEISDMFNCDASIYSIKYFLPANRKTLISISNDKDVKRMVEYSGDAASTDIFLLKKDETPAPPNLRPNRRTRSVVADSVPTDEITASEATEENPKRPKIDMNWESMITGPGQVFESTHAFRNALHKFAMAKGFMYKFVKNDGPRITVRCTTKDCPWRIFAHKTSEGEQELTIHKMHEEHTCGRESRKERNRLATQSWIASVIKDKLKETPDYSPRDIAKDLEREYGFNLSYHRIWRGKSLAEKELHGSHEETASQLPWFCEKILETNPGSVAVFEAMEESKLGRLFISFYASLQGFEHGCRPLLFLESITLKAVKQWKLLTATSVDGENDVFPVAFAVVETDTDENWHWFVTQLRLALPSSRVLTFVSKRQNGVEEIVSEMFEDCHYGYCVNGLVDEFVAELDDTWTEELKDAAIEDMTSAVYACKADEFDECLARIKSTSKTLSEWVLDTKPEKWSNAFFKGVRYGLYSSKAADVFNAWISARTEPSVVQAVDSVRCKIMEMIYFRRENSSAWMEPLTPPMARKVQEEIMRARNLQVAACADGTYEVRGENQGIISVNIGTWECTCRRWQVIGLPCMHAIAVLDRVGRVVTDFCSEYFTTKCYRAAYGTSINPIADPVSNASAYPARAKRGPGRPKLKMPEPMLRTKRPVRCSKCKEYGHHKQTCKSGGLFLQS